VALGTLLAIGCSGSSGTVCKSHDEEHRRDFEEINVSSSANSRCRLLNLRRPEAMERFCRGLSSMRGPSDPTPVISHIAAATVLPVDTEHHAPRNVALTASVLNNGFGAVWHGPPSFPK